MWQKLKFLTFVQFEIERFYKNKSADQHELLNKGIDYTWIQVLYSFHTSMFWMLIRYWFNKQNEKEPKKDKSEVIYSDLDLLLIDMSPKYIVQTKEGIHTYLKLTYEGKRFIKPWGFFIAFLKDSGVVFSFLFGVIAAAGVILGFLGIKEL